MHPAPALRFPALLKALFRSGAKDPSELRGPWGRPQDAVFWTSRSAWSIAAICLVRQVFQNQNDANPSPVIRVWLPAFFCNESLDPLRSSGASLHFYEVDEHLNADPKSLDHLLEVGEPDLIIGVHFFGIPSDFTHLISAARTNSAWFIEDAVHVLRRQDGLGDQGDFVLFSPHKHLALPRGAALILRHDGPSRLQNMDAVIAEAFRMLGAQSSQARTGLATDFFWIIKRTANRIGLNRLFNSGRNLIRTNPTKINTEPDTLPVPEIGWLSTQLLHEYLNDLNNVANARKDNLNRWREHLSPFIDMSPFKDPREEINYIPYLASFRNVGPDRSDNAWSILVRSGAWPSTWPDLPPEVAERPDVFPLSHEFATSYVHLPVHQDISHRALARIGRHVIHGVSQSWKCKIVTDTEWDLTWQRASEPNLVQSRQYGSAINNVRASEVHRWCIYDENSRPIALAQIISSRKRGLIQVDLLNQGPVWLRKEIMSGAECATLLRTLGKGTKASGPTALVYSPPIENSHALEVSMKVIGFRKLKKESWASTRLDLRRDLEILRGNLDGKWRNGLRKAEKASIRVAYSTDILSDWPLIRDLYLLHHGNKGAEVIDVKILDALVATPTSENWNLQLLTAAPLMQTPTKNIYAAILIVRSGDVATYLMGFATAEGRRTNATSLLLWTAIISQKEMGTPWFDVGGLSMSTPEGIARFKRGLGGVPYSTGGYFVRLAKLL